MQEPRKTYMPPRRLLIALDLARLRGMSPTDRARAVSHLAILLMEAAGAASTERDDDVQ
jgi:hypothetical protein